MKERMLAVVRGEAIDRVPFIQYDGISGSNSEIWKQIGRENMGLLRWCGLHRFEHPNCRFETERIAKDGLNGWRRRLITPAGTLVEEKFPNVLGSVATREHFVKTVDDYQILMAYLRDITVHEDLTAVRRAISELGDAGLPLVAVQRTPYQQLWVEWVNLQDLCLHLVDRPDLLEECIALLGDVQRQVFRVVCSALEKVDLPFIDFPDNITAPVLGERYFRKYCLPFYRELAGMLEEKGVIVIVHMDGDLRPLWQAIAESKVKGIDSFTPVPDNDTSVAEAVGMWPEMRLFINFPSSVHLAQPQQIYRRATEILEEGGHTGRIWIQISEDVPPGVWRTSYPEIVRAIRDFGKP